MKTKLLAFCCAALLVLCAGVPAGAEREIPQCLRFVQKMTTTKMQGNRIAFVTYPQTALPEVDREIARYEQRIDELDRLLFGEAATDYVRAAELTDEKAAAEERLLTLYEEQESLSEEDA